MITFIPLSCNGFSARRPSWRRAPRPWTRTAQRCEGVAAGTTQHLAATYRGLATELRRAATGIVLQPRHASDGDLLGVALPRLHGPPPGRGVLVDRGRTLVVQVALTHRLQGQGTIDG